MNCEFSQLSGGLSPFFSFSQFINCPNRCKYAIKYFIGSMRVGPRQIMIIYV